MVKSEPSDQKSSGRNITWCSLFGKPADSSKIKPNTYHMPQHVRYLTQTNETLCPHKDLDGDVHHSCFHNSLKQELTQTSIDR